MYKIHNLESLKQSLEQNFPKSKLNKLQELPDPLLFKDMQNACLLIKQHIKAQSKILIVGDYDVDGVMAVSVLKHFFTAINYPVSSYIPNHHFLISV